MTTTIQRSIAWRQGDDKVEAATFAFRTYALSMLAGTLVTIAGFVPVGFAASSAGEYTFSLFAVVSIALIVSWFVAVVFAPLLGVIILKPPKADKSAGGSKVLEWYRGLLTRAVAGKWVTIALTLTLFVVSILAIPLVPNQFFPSPDRPELLVDLRLPQNASIYASDDMAERFDATLKGDPDVARWSTFTWAAAPFASICRSMFSSPNDFFSQAVIVAKDVAARERLRKKLEKVLANDFPSVVGRVSPLELGPPVGWPVQYRVSGPDIAQVRDSPLRLRKSLQRTTRRRESISTGSNPHARFAFKLIRTKLGNSG